MVEKDLKKLSRTELLELLLVQTRETDRLREQLRRTEEALTQRQLKISEAGNLAQAVLAVNGVMEAAQAAAQQYLDNIAALEAQTKARCSQMLEQARQEASRIQPEVQQEMPAMAAQTRETDRELDEIYQLLEN